METRASDPAIDLDILAVWFASPDEFLAGDNLKHCLSLLSGEELSRLERFVNERDRRQFIAAHSLVRRALSHYYPIAPEIWRFNKNAYGKPRTSQTCGLEFNLAHSTELVACFISSGSLVGIDVEPFRSATAIAEIASEVFSPIELAESHKFSADQWSDKALSIWTLKEAYAKALGIGFSLPPKSFSFAIDGQGEIRLKVESKLEKDSSRWQFCLMDFADHRIAAVMEKRREAHLLICELKAISAEPKWLEPVTRWFPASPPQQSP